MDLVSPDRMLTAACFYRCVRRLLLVITVGWVSAAFTNPLLEGMQAYEAGDYALARKLWQPEAEKGAAVAQYMLGVLYTRGDGVPNDLDAAIYWYRRAADQDSAEAAFGLGRAFEARWEQRRATGGNGPAVELDLKQALYWYRQAQESGESRGGAAAARLALRQQQMQQAAGYSGALAVITMVVVALLFIALALWLMRRQRRQKRLPRDISEAERHFDSVYAEALRGAASAQYQLGLLYLHGRGTTADAQAAVQWWRKGADRGFAAAQRALGLSYLQGTGVSRDAGLAVMWLKRAAERDDPEAQYELGTLYLRADGFAQDFQQVSYWLHKAAASGQVQAQYQLGLLFRDGAGISASAGDGLAAYRPEEGIPSDSASAVRWLEQAAEQGHADAQANLGDMCLNGEGIEADTDAALRWYRLAAGNGNDYAMMKLRRLLTQ